MSHSAPFYLGLGSNVGDRYYYLMEAIRLLDQHQEISWQAFSSIYETVPIGNTNQGPFLNMVAAGETSFSPHQLFAKTQEVELLLGRTRKVYWGPRTIDLDLLLYHNKRIHDQTLIVPHPRMTERGFVLIPLAEISPTIVIPGETKTVLDLLHSRPEEGVHIWKKEVHGGDG